MTSQLQIGNRALRNDDFVTSVQCYLRALDEAPALQRFIGHNLAMARRRLGERRVGRDSPTVAICGWNLALDASRAHSLCLAYEPFASVELIGVIAPGAGSDVWEPLRQTRFDRHTIDGDGAGFVERAFDLVVAHPYDVVHLSKPRAPNIIIGLLYKLVWGSRVLVDLDDDELVAIGADAPINLLSHLAQHRRLPPLEALADSDWTRIAAGLVNHFDGVTVANPALQARHGGTLVHSARDTGRYAQADALRRAGRDMLRVGAATKVVLLCSTPRNPAAVAETAAAIQSSGHKDVVLAVAGATTAAAPAGADCRLLGDRAFDMMAELYAAADVHVQLQDPQGGRSRFRLPTSIIDALAAGLPTLVRLAPGLLDDALRAAVVDVTEPGLVPALRDALAAPHAADRRRAELAPLYESLIGLAPNAALLNGLSGSNAAPAFAALTPESARLIELLPLRNALRSLLPTWMVAAPRPVEPIAPPGADGPAAGAASTRTIRHLPPLATPPPLPPAVRHDIAWIRCREFVPTAKALVLEALGQGLGTLAREDLGTLAASSLPILRSFADLHGRLDEVGLRLRTAGDPEPLPVAGPGLLRPCRWRFERSGVTVADLWFVSDALLRLRLEQAGDATTETAPRVLRAFQLAPGNATLQVVAEVPFVAEGPHFVDLALVNPFFPVLLAVTAADGGWFDLVLLPFPSLCRGGAHHGELAAVGSLPGTMSNLEAMSNSLLAEFTGWREAPAQPAIGCIEVDLQGATGAEKLFSVPVKAWLAEVMHLGSLQPVPCDDTAPTRSFLAAACSIELPAGASATTRQRLDDRVTQGSLALTLSADCLPTISALVSRRLSLAPDASITTGAWVVAQSATGRPRSVVSMPPRVESLRGLQAAGQPLCFPLLRRRATADGAGARSAAESQAPLPLAIRYRDAVKDPAAAVLLPVAPDHSGPLLRRMLSDTERQSAAVSLLVTWQPGGADIAPLLESVARQTLAGAVEVVVMMAPGGTDEPTRIEALLASLFPGRGRVLPCSAEVPSARLNQAAAQAGGRHFLIADGGTVLHDPRTLEALVTLALDPAVATAACVVLREVAFKKGTEVRFFSGGVFPRQLSFHSRPALVLDEPYTANAFPLATYPVVGNSFRLALVSAAAWSQLGGLDSAQFPGHRGDLDFCLRALRAGFTHLCTGVVSATDLTPGGTEEHADTHALGFMPLDRWQQVMAAATVLRDLEA